MKISDVAVVRVKGHWDGATFPPAERQARQMDVYPEIPQHAGNAGAAGKLEALYLEVMTDEGLSGLWGSIELDQAFIILTQLRAFLIGREPLATETLLDQMLRLNRHGRSGLFVTAVSAVDCALWDLKGKAWGQPVYRLLGGPTRRAVPAYASMLSFPIDPDGAAATAREYKQKGYNAQKWFFRFGPGDGAAGKERNLAMAYAVREAVGPRYTLMFDAFMGWDVPYALEMAAALAPLHPFFLEEPVPPERIGALQQIRQAGVAVATGEHVYTRWQVKELLAAGAVDVVQADPDWTGGVDRAGEDLHVVFGLLRAGNRPRPLAAAGLARSRGAVARRRAHG